MSTSQSRVVAGLALAAAVVVLAAPPAAAVAGGLLLGLVLPGTALLDVLFRRRALTGVERVVLTPALSMGVLIVAGLLIHGAGLTINRLSWTVATVTVTLAGVITARLLPRRRVRVADPTDVSPRPLAEPVTGGGDSTVVMTIAPVTRTEDDHRRLRLRQVLPLVVVAAVLGGASWLSLHTARAAHDIVVTALSATPAGPVDAAGNRTVRVAASGLVAADGPYTVSVTGRAGTATVRRTVAVTDDGTWAETLSLPGRQRMTVNLYRSGDTTAYRTLYLSAVD